MKFITTFIALFAIVFISIDTFRRYTKKEQWDIFTTLTRSAFLTLVIMVTVGFIVLSL